MSRTYHHGKNARIGCRGFKHRGTYGVQEDYLTPPKKPRYHRPWHWMHDPSWWIREFMTVPLRAETRTLLHKIFQLEDLEDTPEFPLWNKPYLYYW